MPRQHCETRLIKIYLPCEGKAFSSEVVLEIKLGDVVYLKKKHPCGSYDWQVVRLGTDIGIKCL